MALQIDLVGLGLPTELAALIGLAQLTSVTTAGTTQGTATAITTSASYLVTAGSQTGGILPANAVLDKFLFVYNSTATGGVVYPPVGGYINSGAINAGFAVSQNEGALFMRINTTQWVAFSTVTPNILASANAFTGANTYSDRQFFRQTAPSFTKIQGTPTAKTVTNAISAAELLTSLITTTGVTAPSIHQLPTGTLLTAAIAGVAAGDSFDFSIINTGAGGSDDATITVNTDVTIVGGATVLHQTSGLFRARYTTGVTWIVYRLA